MSVPAAAVDALQSDTIVAPATALAPAGVAVVRLSGAEALRIGARVAGREPSRLRHGQMCFGGLSGPNGPLDHGYVVAFHGPRSFTTEDVVEIHCHGAPAIVRAICDAAVQWGARPARPGEFTRRAWLGGRLDLTQAEGLLDLISSESEAARTQALAHLDGRLSEALRGIRSPLVGALAELEARLDFATEEDVDDLDRGPMLSRLDGLQRSLRKWVQSAEAGRLRVEGARVAMYGAPNAGKSTLFNALLGVDRALVHDQPGTTRDHLEASSHLDGLKVTWVDTAGIRDAAQEVEVAGIARALEAAAASDVVVWLADRSKPFPPLPPPAGADSPAGPVVLRFASHADRAPLREAAPHLQWPAICAHDPVDVDAVAAAVREALRERVGARGDELALSRARHATALSLAADHVARCQLALRQEAPLELACADLRDAIEQLDEVIGTVVPDDVLDAIFSQFCIGK